jgi:carotenoid cleavage dioxygenase-like enzyme
MIHSFAITEQDAICDLLGASVVFSLEAALQGADNPFSWQPEYGARIGILPLGGLASEIRWVEIEPCYVFHEVNAYRDGDDVVIDVCRHDRMFAGEDLGDTDLTLRRWRVSTGGLKRWLKTLEPGSRRRYPDVAHRTYPKASPREGERASEPFRRYAGAARREPRPPRLSSLLLVTRRPSLGASHGLCPGCALSVQS